MKEIKMSEPLSLVPGKTDAEYAKELKEKIIEVYKPLLEVLTQANKDGFVVQCDVGPGAFGIVINRLIIMKQL
jgi:hypothetical protein